MKELQYLNKYFFKYKYRFLFGILTTIVAQIFSLFTPKLISKSVNAIETSYANGTLGNEGIKRLLLENILLITATTIAAAILILNLILRMRYFVNTKT
jgi:ATP-binding cassette subfamily B multidrug efflux pump